MNSTIDLSQVAELSRILNSQCIFSQGGFLSELPEVGHSYGCAEGSMAGHGGTARRRHTFEVASARAECRDDRGACSGPLTASGSGPEIEATAAFQMLGTQTHRGPASVADDFCTASRCQKYPLYGFSNAAIFNLVEKYHLTPRGTT
jgi:hypothetical protein